jgi:hypothetical protein
MRTWVLATGLGVVVLAGLAFGYTRYRDHAREQAVSSFAKKSKPEFQRVDEAMVRVYRDTTPGLLGAVDGRRIRRAKSLARRARLARDEAAFRRELTDGPRAQIKAVRDVLRTADVPALTEVDEPALAGSSAKLRAAHVVADHNRRLLHDIPAVLSQYDTVITSLKVLNRRSVAFDAALAEDADRLSRAAAPGNVRSGLAAMSRRLAGSRDLMRRFHPAPDLRPAFKVSLAYENGVLADLRRLVQAIDDRDVATIDAAGASIDRRGARLRRDPRNQFRQLMLRSSLSHRLQALARQQARLRREYDDLSS